MKKLNYFLISSLILGFIACSPKAAENAPACDSTAVAVDTMGFTNGYVGSTASKENPSDKNHQFVRTADLHFQVQNVIHSTYRIEDAVSHMGGFVSHTELRSDIMSKENSRISNDSVVEITRYSVMNTMTIRVPNVKLDSTLKIIAKEINFMDARTINANDVSLQLLSNKLAIKRGTKNQNRLTHAIDNRGKKLAETTTAEEQLTGKEEQVDNAYINNLSIADQINYSTIEIEMYQRTMVKHDVYAEPKNDSRYEPGLFQQIGESFVIGWSILKSVVAFICKMWGLILLVIIGYLLYRLKKKA